jgi:hypothetical protein
MNVKRLFFVGIGIVSIVMGIIKYYEPSNSPPSGRWAFVLAPIYQAFGPQGVGIAFLLFGICLALVGLLLKETK